jgi:hypothetical protein
MVTSKLENMKNEVIEIHNRIKKICETNKKLEKIYNGCVISSSPICINPYILFFGINPSGKYEIFEQKPDPKGYGFFWEEMKNCLKAINKEKLLENIVVTNRYFFSTKNVESLNKFFDLVNMEFPNWEIQNKQVEWTRTIINEVQPKLIIVAGKTIWKKFNSIFSNNIEIIQKGKHTKVMKINGIILIAYERKFDNMVGKEEFIKFLDIYTQGD